MSSDFLILLMYLLEIAIFKFQWVAKKKYTKV